LGPSCTFFQAVTKERHVLMLVKLKQFQVAFGCKILPILLIHQMLPVLLFYLHFHSPASF